MDELMLNYAAHFLFDDEEVDLNEPAVWVKVTVNVDEYRFMADAAFKLHFRMKRDVFEELVIALGHHVREEEVHSDPEYNLGHVLLMIVWLLATPDTFRSVALRFGKTPGVLHFHYVRMIRTLSEMSGTLITWPSPLEREMLKRSVQRRTGFPGVVGALDGTHIKVTTPSEEPARYFNRHHDHSIVLQAVSDETLLLRDIYVGEPGGTHDSRVFRRSPLCRNLLENGEHHLSDDEHILGDGAYILTDKVLTPFRDYGILTEEQLNYNHRHASARVVVERAYGLLKGKWRRLKMLTAVNMEYAILTIVACIVLHNFILLEGDDQPEEHHGIMNVHPQENIELLIDDGADVDFDHPNVPLERDHPLLADARILGIEKRRDIMARLPPPLHLQ